MHEPRRDLSRGLLITHRDSIIWKRIQRAAIAVRGLPLDFTQVTGPMKDVWGETFILRSSSSHERVSGKSVDVYL